MRNQGNIPEDEIEKAWNTAGRPLVRASEGSDKFKEERLRGKEQIQDFVARERRKEKKRAESDAKPVSSPRPYEGPLPNSIVSWASGELIFSIVDSLQSRALMQPRFLSPIILRNARTAGSPVVPTTARSSRGPHSRYRRHQSEADQV